MDIKTLNYVLFVLLSLNITACDFRTPEQRADEAARIQAEKEDKLTNEEELQFANMKFDHNKYRVLKRANRFFLVPNGWDIGGGVIPYAGDGFVFHWFPAGSSCPRTWDDINKLSPECKLAAEKSDVMVFIRASKEGWEKKITTTSKEACIFKPSKEKIGIPFKWNGLFIGIDPYRNSPTPYDKDWKSVCESTIKVLDQIIEIK